VISFDVPRDWSDGALARALNSQLPPDVRAIDSRPVPASFHARRFAVSKAYRYVLDIGLFQHPARRNYAGHTPFDLDGALVERAAEIFLGERDFASLQTSGSSVRTTTRRVTRSAVSWSAIPGATETADVRVLTYDVEADGFLRRMARAMVGGLIAAGRGVATIDALRSALHAKDRRAWPAAPADPGGLYLVSVRYPEDEAEPPRRALLESDDVD
jgi:tRNA pseudouridine38-40 synthase